MGAREKLMLVQKGLRRKHSKDSVFTEVICGAAGSARIDFMALRKSWAKPNIAAYEIKVSRGDFLADHKWENYLPFCHTFYFACPANIIHADEVTPPAGLVYITPQSTRCVKSAIHRPHEMSWQALYHLLMSRAGVDHPGRTPEREQRADEWHDWMKNNKSFKDLGWELRQHISAKTKKLTEKEKVIAEASIQFEESQKAREILKPLMEYSWEWEEALPLVVQEVLSQREKKLSVRDIDAAIKRLGEAKELLV